MAEIDGCAKMNQPVILGDVARIQGGYAFKSNDFTANGVPVLKIKNVKKGEVSFREIDHVSKEIAILAENWSVKTGDILISMTGSGPNQPNSAVGRVAYLKDTDPVALINQRIGRLVFRKPLRYSRKFVYYYLSSAPIQEFFLNNSRGSANQANISNGLIESIKMPNIDLSSSERIGDLLAVIDTKIELNKLMNETLDQIGQALFKYYFIDAKDKSFGKIGDIVTQNSEKVGKSDQSQYTILSAVKTGYLIPSSDYFTKQVFSKDLSPYKILRQFDVAYNPARVN